MYRFGILNFDGCSSNERKEKIVEMLIFMTTKSVAVNGSETINLVENKSHFFEHETTYLAFQGGSSYCELRSTNRTVTNKKEIQYLLGGNYYSSDVRESKISTISTMDELKEFIDQFEKLNGKGRRLNRSRRYEEFENQISSDMRTGRNRLETDFDFIDFDAEDSKMISVVNKSRYDKVGEDFYLPSMRKSVAVKMKPGKFFKKLYPDATAKWCEDFATQVRLINRDEKDFKLEVRKDVRFCYDEKNYGANKGQLGSSCMKHSNKNHFMEFYEGNNVKVLALMAFGKVFGRALLWDDVHFKDLKKDGKYMDRVFMSNSMDTALFNKWAIDNGYYHRDTSGRTSGLHNPKGDPVKSAIIFSNKGNLNTEYEVFPYLDTFGSMSLDKSELSSVTLKYHWSMRSTGGTINHNGRWSKYYKEALEPEKSVRSEELNDNIKKELAVVIEDEEYEDTFFMPDDHGDIVTIGDKNYLKTFASVLYSKHEEEHFLRNDRNFVFSKSKDDWIPRNVSIFSKHHNDWMLFEDAVFVHCTDSYYNKSEVGVSIFEHEETYVTKDEMKKIEWAKEFQIKMELA